LIVNEFSNCHKQTLSKSNQNEKKRGDLLARPISHFREDFRMAKDKQETINTQQKQTLKNINIEFRLNFETFSGLDVVTVDFHEEQEAK